MNQLLNLLKLHPEILAYLRACRFVSHGRPPTERSLRPLTVLSTDEQLETALEALPGFRAIGSHARQVASGQST